MAGLTAPTLGDVNASDTVSTAISPPASTATLNGTLTATGGENQLFISFGGTMMLELIIQTCPAGTIRLRWGSLVPIIFYQSEWFGKGKFIKDLNE